MADMSLDGDSSAEVETPAPASPPPRRGPGHRGADASDTAAEMARRAHEISLEAGSRMAGAMRDVVRAAAGLSAFAIESARELVHYMVRRGQMNADEGDVLIAEAEAAYIQKHGALPEPEPPKPAPKPQPLNVRPPQPKPAPTPTPVKAAEPEPTPSRRRRAKKAAAEAKPPPSACSQSTSQGGRAGQGRQEPCQGAPSRPPRQPAKAPAKAAPAKAARQGGPGQSQACRRPRRRQGTGQGRSQGPRQEGREKEVVPCTAPACSAPPHRPASISGVAGPTSRPSLRIGAVSSATSPSSDARTSAFNTAPPHAPSRRPSCVRPSPTPALDSLHGTVRSDFPVGAGLGGSSAACVALAAATAAWRGRAPSPAELAETSRQIEVERSASPAVGRTTTPPRMAARSRSSSAMWWPCTPSRSPDTVHALETRCLVYYTGESRISGDTIRAVLDGYAERVAGGGVRARPHGALARLMATALAHGDVDALGALVGEHWVHQRSLHPGITTPRIDALVAATAAAGALGAKPLGASGGGCVAIIAAGSGRGRGARRPRSRWPNRCPFASPVPGRTAARLLSRTRTPSA
jgi:mevalonate kinase